VNDYEFHADGEDEEVEADFEPDFGDGGFSDDEGDELPPDALDEFAAVTDAEEDTLATARAAIEEERERTRSVLERYRAAMLAAEPALPPELVQGETLEELDASVAAARAAVGEIRARLASEGASAERGFPVGAPARGGPTTAGLSSSEKIRRGLEERLRS
jgi:hypothetical protein